MKMVKTFLLMLLISGWGVGAFAQTPPETPAIYRLKVEVVGEGEVLLSPEGEKYGDIYWYSSGEREPIDVELTANPQQDWYFSHWEIGPGIPPSTSDTVTSNPTMVTLSTDAPAWTVRAVFVQELYYTVEVTADPPEGGVVEGGGTYPPDEEVTVSATANPCYEFVNWTEDGVEVSTEPEFTFTVTSNRHLVAHFQLKQFTVTLEANPPEGGTVSGGGTFPCGTSVTVRAIANEGFEFLNWTENGSVVSWDPTYTFDLTADRSLVANFEAVVPGLTYEYPAGWNMISIPLEPGNVWFSGIPAPTLFHWDPESGTYQMITDPSTMEPALGYWLYVPSGGTVAYVSGEEVQADGVIPAAVPGWYMISSPWTFRVGDIVLQMDEEQKGWAEAAEAGWITPVIFHWDPTESVYQVIDDPKEYLNPWEGYWLRVLVADVTIVLPYDSAGPPGPPIPGGVDGLSTLAGIASPPPPPPVPTPGFSQLDVINEPNPVVDVHTTVFKVVGPAAAYVEAMRVKIFDASGRLVYEAEAEGPELVWHTQDLTGAYLANGVYLYRVEVKVAGNWITTEVKKLAICR